MRAIRITAVGGPEVMRLEDCPELVAGAGELVVEIRGIGVNPVDTYLRAGAQGYSPKLPYTPGLDAAGVVLEVGAGVDGFRVGDRVYLFGSLSGLYAEQALCLERQVFALPERLSFAQGAALGVPYGTAYRALFQRGSGVSGEAVLVHGASGGVGLAAVQLALGAGMRVFATAGSEAGLTLVRSAGVEAVVNHGVPGHLERMKAEAGLEGFDLILEMLANVNLDSDLPVLARGGRVVVIGNRGRVEINPRDLMGRDASIIGMSLLNATGPELARIHAALAEGMARGVVDPVIACTLPLAEAPKAHRMIMEEPARGKIVLIP